ncbi:uncharacterized protein [Nicotiana tomentosiformis]|uniref:uncharacterized protein isoform X6 n=1 Tax=Nicotiana tomentosiformis TaxID=4098 RepID=UPI000878BE91|nr:uncharacterized isomerase BH0283 isoform X5 [Nicotiana tomentosiformis]
MATSQILQTEQDLLMMSSLFDDPKGENVKSRGIAIEKKIEFLESLAGKVSNRRSRRWLNDRLLMELVPRLNAEEIRGLFAPPPFGDDVPLSVFCLTNVEEWDKFRNIDMDKEATIMDALEGKTSKRKNCVDNDKVAVLTAWHRVDCRTREALRRNFLPELVSSYEQCVRAFAESGDGEVLVLRVQDPFHRLLLHGVCEVDAFTDAAFKGNPAAVCLLEEEKDDKWLQSVATEFNMSQTCYLTPITLTKANPTFGLRWFTPVTEVDLCGHATLAAAHFLFAYGFVKTDTIEFSTKSGILTAKRVPEAHAPNSQDDWPTGYSIELDFPVLKVAETNFADVPAVSKSLNGASVVEMIETSKSDLFILLPSGEAVVECQPQFDQIKNFPGRGIIITGPAPQGSGFDFYSRFFCPKFRINEDPVCGSAHCALAPYWRKKLAKCDFVALAASPRGGVVKVHLDEENQRVFLRGKAVAVMEGSLLV